MTRLRMPAVSMNRQVAAAELDQLVDRVDGGAGDVVDDDPLAPGQPVEQRGLADVGLADDRDPARSADLGVALGRRLGQRGEDGVEQVAGAAAVQRGDDVRLAEPEVPQRVRLGLGAGVVDLVGGEHDRLLRPAQDLDDGLVGVGDADGRVDDEQHGVGQADRDLGLGGDPLGQAAGVGVPAAGVDDGERAARPVGVVGDPVAGHAGHVLDDRLAAADDPVDQRRLADVGAADDGQDRQRSGGRACGQRRARAWWSLIMLLGRRARCRGRPRTVPAAAGRAGRSRSSRAPRPESASSRSRSSAEVSRTIPGVRGHGCGSTHTGSPKVTCIVLPRGGRESASPPGSRVPSMTTGTTGAPVTSAR